MLGREKGLPGEARRVLRRHANMNDVPPAADGDDLGHHLRLARHLGGIEVDGHRDSAGIDGALREVHVHGQRRQPAARRRHDLVRGVRGRGCGKRASKDRDGGHGAGETVGAAWHGHDFLARFSSAMPHPYAMRRRWVIGVAGVPVLAVGLIVAHLALRPRPVPSPLPAASAEPPPPPLAHIERAPPDDEVPPPEPAPLSGLDLAAIAFDGTGAFAPTPQGAARLTIDPELQRTVSTILAARHFPEASVVLMEVETGHVLVYASHIEGQPARDLLVEATAPSASVFKIVTAAALVEEAHVTPETQRCYSGGEQRIGALDLVEDPRRDRWCTTVAGAMGRSINTIFARLAKEELTPPKLEAMARRFGYGRALAFDVPVQPSSLHVPTEPLEFARTAAGFWNSTLSPLEAVELSAIVAHGGETVRPSIVEKVATAAGAVAWTPPDPAPARRVVAKETADQLEQMMERTVSDGTCFRAFHDVRGTSYLPGITVAGKTGTLTDPEPRRYYTWFTGFAPVHPQGDVKQVAVAVLVVNGPNWELKANVVARETLRAYFAEHGAQGVSRPSVEAVARHKRKRS